MEIAKLLVEDCKLQDLLKPPEQLSAIAALSHYHYTEKTLLWGLTVLEGAVLLHCSIYKPFCVQSILQLGFTDMARKERKYFLLLLE